MGNAVPFPMVFWSLLSSKLLGNPGRWRSHKSSRDKCWPAQLAHAPGWLWMRCKRERPQWEREQNCAERKTRIRTIKFWGKTFSLGLNLKPRWPYYLDWFLMEAVENDSGQNVRVRSFDWITIQCTFFSARPQPNLEGGKNKYSVLQRSGHAPFRWTWPN